MPQVFQVLCCYNCEIFQVHFVKKSNKWQCKVCNEKQSLKKAFKIGISSECRSLVQQLNMQRGCQKQMVNAKEEAVGSTVSEERHVPNPDKVNELEYIDHFSGYNGSEDELWSESDDFSNNRFNPDNLSELDCANPTNKNNSLTEEMKLSQTFKVKSQQKDSVNSLTEDVKKDKPILSENIQNCDKQKRFYESCNDTSSPTSIPRPFKKNRGFEFIKNAASKLG